MARYMIFTRTWWKRNPKWPGGREPHKGRKTIIKYVDNPLVARQYCEEYNRTHPAGKLGRKAEWMEV